MTHPPDPDLLSLNTAPVREKWTLRQMIEGCARHRIRGISPWRDKLAEMGTKEAAKTIRDNGLTVTGLCRGGMFPAADRRARRAAIDDNLRAIDDAATLEASCLVLVVGGLPSGSQDLAGARQMEKAGYRGFHEVEILSSGNWWQRDPDEVLATCRVRHQTAC